jgi:hypothetical protein
MSNEKNNIDELFRGKLREFSVEAPEHVWKGIEASRTPLHRAINYFKSRKGAALGSFILLATVSSIAYFVGSDTEQLSQQNNTIHSIQRYNNTASIQAEKYSDAIAMKVGNNYTANGIAANNQTNAADFTSPKSLIETITTAEEGKNETLNTSGTPSSAPITDKEATSNGDDKNTLNPQEPTKNAPTVAPTEEKKESETPVIAKDKTETKQLDTKGDNNPKTDATLTAAASTTKGDGIDKADKSAGQSATTVEPVKNFSKFAADIYGGGNYTMRSLSNSGANQNYFNAKRDAESYRPGFVVGARVNYNLKEFLTLRVGAQYTRFNQRINLNREYQYTTIETTTGEVIDPITQQPTGVTFTRTDTVEKTETAIAGTTNTISFLDIPVQLELDFYKKDKLSVFATAGAAINLRFTQKGSQLNQRLTGLDEISSANNPFKTTAGISILAGVGMKYNLSQRYSLLIETNYQHGVSNVMKNNAGMHQSYRVITGTVGLRYRF